MIARKTRTIPTTLERARQRFERWRKVRPSLSPIPKALWALAVKMAQEHGVSRTAQTLRLDYYTLKERVQAADGSARLPQPTSAFVELLPQPSGLSPCTIELENGQGAKMKIHLARPEAVDLLALSRSLWRAEG
jgi:hypothetical protein